MNFKKGKVVPSTLQMVQNMNEIWGKKYTSYLSTIIRQMM